MYDLTLCSFCTANQYQQNRKSGENMTHMHHESRHVRQSQKKGTLLPTSARLSSERTIYVGYEHNESIPSELTDAELVKRARHGDQEAFTALVRRYANAVFGAALARARHLYDAEDIAQEVFIKAYFKLHQLREPERVGAWLYQITQRALVQWYRRADNSVSLFDQPPEPAETNEPAAELLVWMNVKEHLNRLPEEARTVLVLRYLVDWPNSKIAAFLAIPVGTVESRLARARKRLRRVMNAMADELKGKRLGDEFAERVRDLIEVKVVIGPRISLSPGRSSGLLRLEYEDQAAGETKHLPIVIGMEQLNAIQGALEGTSLPRPMTADLLVRVIEGLGGQVRSAVVSEVPEATFYAELYVLQGEKHVTFDCRPSDAVNVALRAKAPIYVAKDLAKRASMTPSQMAGSKIDSHRLERLPAPAGWRVAGSSPGDYDIGVDHNGGYEGRAAAYIRPNTPEPHGFSTMMQMISAQQYLGSRIHLAAYIKVADVADWAGLWMRVDGPSGEILAFDSMQNRKITGTQDWERHEIALDVPPNSVRIAFGLLLAGTGQVWMSDLTLACVPTERSFPAPNLPNQPRNLDFAE